jgi:hypothetical protein
MKKPKQQNSIFGKPKQLFPFIFQHCTAVLSNKLMELWDCMQFGKFGLAILSMI